MSSVQHVPQLAAIKPAFVACEASSSGLQPSIGFLTTQSRHVTRSSRDEALSELRAKLLQHKEVDAKVRQLRDSVAAAKKEYDKTEDDLKALQSVGQIIGEVLRQLDAERCESSRPCVRNIIAQLFLVMHSRCGGMPLCPIASSLCTEMRRQALHTGCCCVRMNAMASSGRALR